MLKVTPFFPMSTKDKHASTCASLMKHKFQHKDFADSWKLGTQTRKKSIIDLSRLLKLAEPRVNKHKQILFSETSPHFYRQNRRYSSKENILSDRQSENIPKAYKNLAENDTYRKGHWSKQIIVPKYPKMLQEKWGYKNFETFQSNQYQAIHKLDLRKENTQIWNRLISKSIFKNPKMKQKKQKMLDSHILKSSDLSSIYSSLYNRYEVMPFNELEKRDSVLVKQLENEDKKNEKEQSEQQVKKEGKSFAIKKLEFQKNLRKQIKSLTRDTDHILSLEFRDIRQINIR